MTTGEAKRQDWETCTIIPAPTADCIGTLTSAGGNAVPGNTVQDAVAHQLIPMTAHTLRAMNHAGSHANAGGQVAVAFHPTQDPISSTDGTTHCMGTGSSQGTATIAVAFHENQRAEVTLNDTAGTVKCAGGKPGQGYPAALVNMAVRRLTPRECERLQGFEDNYTRIPWRGKPAEQCPHGPRYKALGNSWAVPCARWVGVRIVEALA